MSFDLYERIIGGPEMRPKERHGRKEREGDVNKLYEESLPIDPFRLRETPSTNNLFPVFPSSISASSLSVDRQ